MGQEALVIHRERRVRRVGVSLDLILDLLKIPADGLVVNGARIMCMEYPIPESAKVIGACINDNGEVELLVEDASFQALDENCRVPVYNPVYYWAMPIQANMEQTNEPTDASN